MDPEQQAQELSLRQLQALLEAQARLRKAAEDRAREVQQELEHLAEAVCPEEVDRLRSQSPDGLAALTPRQVAQMVLKALAPRLRAGRQEQEPATRTAELKARLRQLEARLKSAEARAARAEAEAERLRQRLQMTEALLSPHPLVPRPPVRAAADLLAAAGYEVVFPSGPLSASGNTAFRPDLILRLEGKELPVEVEDLSRPPAEREARWEACHAIGEGHLLFVAPDARTLDRLRSEVFFWSGDRPLKLWMTDLERGRGQKGEAVWLVRRG